MKFILGAFGKVIRFGSRLAESPTELRKRALAETIFSGEQPQTEGYCPRRSSKAKPA
jgi:hypothetical protein